MIPKTTPSRWIQRLAGLLGAASLVLAIACGGAETAPEEAAEDTAAEDTAAAPAPAAEEGGAPRVYFVEPTDGAVLSVAEPVHVMFEVENFQIEPVGEGMVHEGFGHHHLAIDGECLPAGTVIPTAEPWIHFGDGSNMIEVPLSAGEHTLTLQIGDGEHRTLDEPGLCTSITVTVEEAGEESAEG
ncbi:MAG TPA: DUF4399 domain-containing protein [Thermoanaerobaculia bacterium]|nr:DUF4399 domain-containing protein [Thermoanaerobaculia bacterium]